MFCELVLCHIHIQGRIRFCLSIAPYSVRHTVRRGVFFRGLEEGSTVPSDKSKVTKHSYFMFSYDHNCHFAPVSESACST